MNWPTRPHFGQMQRAWKQDGRFTASSLGLHPIFQINDPRRELQREETADRPGRYKRVTKMPARPGRRKMPKRPDLSVLAARQGWQP